jgi:molecular chaperone DnaK (HSP70)
VLGDGDACCRVCGERLIDVEVTPAAIVFMLDEHGEAAPALVRIDNTGSASPLRVTAEVRHPAVVLERPPGAVELHVPAGELAHLTLSLNPSALASLPADRTFGLDVRVAPDAPPVVIPISVGQRPQITVDIEAPPPLRQGTRRAIHGRIQHVAGLVSRLRATRAAPGLTVLAPEVGQTLQRGSDVALHVECDSSAMVSGPQATWVELEWEHEVVTRVDLPIRIVTPAWLRVAFLGSSTVFAGTPGRFDVALRNTGGEALTVTALRVEQAPAWFGAALPALPLTLEPDQRHVLHCRVDGEEVQPGTLTVTLVASLKDEGDRPYPLRIHVRALEPYPHFVAIDFGTTNSCVAFWKQHRVAMTPFVDSDHAEHAVVPSVAYFDSQTGQWLGGFDAIAAARAHKREDALVHSVKRLLNRGVGDSPDLWSRTVEVDGVRHEPEVVAAGIFRYLRQQTERHLGAALDKVMISLPANFSDTGVHALMRAAREAGLRPFQLDRRGDWAQYRIDEPTAAAIEAAVDPGGETHAERLLLVFDFGGGTLDVSVLLVTTRADLRRVQVLAHKGANWLGGDDFTAVLMRLVADHYHIDKKRSLDYDVDAMKASGDWDRLDEAEQLDVALTRRLLWENCELAKARLSADSDTTVVTQVSQGGRLESFHTVVTRDEFETAVSSLVDAALAVVDRALTRAARQRPGLTIGGIDEVIATGRTSLIPLVRRRLQEHCEGKTLFSRPNFEEKECVSRGACRYGVENLDMAGDANIAPLEFVGIHDVTNCSYGYNKGAGEGIARNLVFQPLIPEGISLKSDGEAEPPIFSDRGVTVSVAGSATLTFYQHTGDPDNNRIADNRDIIAIDSIVIRQVKVPDRRRPPIIEVRMWLARDGLLDAEARVDGHEHAFRLVHRQRES